MMSLFSIPTVTAQTNKEKMERKREEAKRKAELERERAKKKAEIERETAKKKAEQKREAAKQKAEIERERAKAKEEQKREGAKDKAEIEREAAKDKAEREREAAKDRSTFGYADVGQVKLGVQVSPSVSWMTTDDNFIISEGMLLGSSLGLFGEYYFHENYSLRSGISLLSRQGGGLEYRYNGNFLPKAAESRAQLADVPQLDSISSGSIIKYNLQYLEIPISMRLRTSGYSNIRYFAELPILSIAFRLKGEADVSNNTFYDDIQGERISNDINPVSFNIGIGAGVEYDVNNQVTLIGGVYYSSSLLDITKNNGTTIFESGMEEQSRASLRSINIRFGILF